MPVLDPERGKPVGWLSDQGALRAVRIVRSGGAPTRAPTRYPIDGLGTAQHLFAYLDCRHGAYAIDVNVDDYARISAVYHLDDRRIPSPLMSPQCPACEDRKIRILRPECVPARLHET